ncbi:hypothetical protein VMT65_05415 [Nocardia sp. CDC153]|uniref:hypothetical protein n=1 Tax=Nocardia sp. CDC153 TaxID=3112167 RepID=UPI002DB8BC0D|nr:hypothetical protein [Nocardia sp. CDC153]MEC3952466.1 hypothetical protein [Nocardia sp. CDC153]
MEFRSTTAAAALVVGALTAGLGTAHAEPAPNAAIRYSLKVVDKSVVASVRGAKFVLTERDETTPGGPKVWVAEIEDEGGATVVSMPLDYRIGDVRVPIRAVTKNDGSVLEITPTKPEGLPIADPATALKPIASPTEDQKALNEFSSKLSVAGQVGALVGGIVGFIAGCVVSIAIGCIPGGVAGVPAGGIIGGLVAGGPTLVAAGIDLLNTWQAAPGTSKWADPQPQPTPQN